MWAAPPPTWPATIATTQPPLRRQLYTRQLRKQVGPPLRFKAELKSEQESGPIEQEDTQPQQLSAADVLIALERRAKVKKASKQRKQESSFARRKTRAGGNQQGAVPMVVDDFSNVKPISVIPEWSQRLQDLETRLEQLIYT